LRFIAERKILQENFKKIFWSIISQNLGNLSSKFFKIENFQPEDLLKMFSKFGIGDTLQRIENGQFEN
jgi:hypothetical protein